MMLFLLFNHWHSRQPFFQLIFKKDDPGVEEAKEETSFREYLNDTKAFQNAEKRYKRQKSAAAARQAASAAAAKAQAAARAKAEENGQGENKGSGTFSAKYFKDQGTCRARVPLGSGYFLAQRELLELGAGYFQDHSTFKIRVLFGPGYF